MTKGIRKKSVKALRRKQMNHCNLVQVHRAASVSTTLKPRAASSSLRQHRRSMRQTAIVARSNITHNALSTHSCLCKAAGGRLCRAEDGCEQRLTLQYVLLCAHAPSSQHRRSSECVRCSVSAHNKCHNRALQRQDFPPTSVRDAPGKGKGLFADRAIKSGVVVIEYVGVRINGDMLQRRLQQHQASGSMCYFMLLAPNVWIDANIGRGNLINKAGRINHCCAPNCVTQVFQVPVFARGARQGQHGRFLRYEPRIAVVATRALQKDEEVTIDYRWRSVDGNRHVCRCGVDSCTGFL